MKKHIYLPFIMVLSSVLIWSWWIIFYRIPLNPDGGYYLSVAERICEGWKPYRDFHVAYPPAGFYFFALFRKIFGEGYIAFKAALLSIGIISFFCFYLLSGLLVKDRRLRIAGGLFFLLLSLAYDGNGIFLEPFVTVFSMISILLLSIDTKKYYISAFFAGTSFLLACMSKQYGILILPCLIILFFKDVEGLSLNFRKVMLKTMFFFAGFSIGLFLMLFYLNINMTEFILQLSGRGYGSAGIVKLVKSLVRPENIWL
jgi:4-amino-4-deoxy-L-arabinose transferase-like glycosyltransferase